METTKKISVEQLEKDYVKGLDEEEIELLQDFETGSYIPVSEERKLAFKATVKANLEKRKHISIKPLEADIIKIKAKAISKGIPYQTLINSILHQFANNKLIEQT